MARRRTILLVDDQKDEIERIRKYLGSKYAIAAGMTINAAQAELQKQGRRSPDLCLVDLYYPDGEPDSPDPVAELNESRAQLLKAEVHFNETLARLRQTTSRGRRNVHQLRKLYPRRPLAFFTRKGTLDNAIEAYESRPKAIPVIKKPDPAPKEASQASASGLPELYDLAFKRGVGDVEERIETIIRENGFWYRYRQSITGFITGLITGVLASVIGSVVVNRLSGH